MSSYYIEAIRWGRSKKDKGKKPMNLPTDDFVDLPNDTDEDDVYDLLRQAVSKRHGWRVTSLSYSIGRNLSVSPMHAVIANIRTMGHRAAK